MDRTEYRGAWMRQAMGLAEGLWAADTPANASARFFDEAQASISAKGIASFAGGSGTTLADALHDIAARFTAAGDSDGEFALFRLNNAGSFYLFISDGGAGVGAGDSLVQLQGITSIGSISLSGGDLTILT